MAEPTSMAACAVGAQRGRESGDLGYGWYEEAEEEREECASSDDDTCSSSQSYGSPARRPSYFSKKPLVGTDSALLAFEQQDVAVLFAFSNVYSSSSCRSFQQMLLKSQLRVQLSLPRFRIVQDWSGIRVEFKVQMVIEDETVGVWKRYSEFCALASKIGIASGIMAYLSPPDFNRHLAKTRESWQELERNKRWLRSLSVRYLAWKSAKLEEFLKNLLFENPTLDLLVEFVRPV